MGTTPIYQLPYPDPRLPLPYATPTSTPDVPTDVKQLADRLELVLPTIASGGPSTVWLPLSTTNANGDDVLVYDDDHSLIPTLVPF